jgi:hypothetical protein
MNTTVNAFISFKLNTVIWNIRSRPANQEIHSDIKIVNGHPFSFVIKPDDGTYTSAMVCWLKYHGETEIYFMHKITLLINKSGFAIPQCEAKFRNPLQHLSKAKSETEKTHTWISLSTNTAVTVNVRSLFGDNLFLEAELTFPLLNETEKNASDVKTLSIYNNLQTDIQNLFQEDDNTSDITILTSNDLQIKAHKTILCARSTVFKAMLTSNLSEATSKTIKIEDFEYDVVNAFIRYLYTDKCSESDLKSHGDYLLAISHKYEVLGLFSICEEYLQNHVNITNIVNLLQISELYGAKLLKSKCVQFISDHTHEIFDQNPAADKLCSHIKIKPNIEPITTTTIMLPVNIKVNMTIILQSLALYAVLMALVMKYFIGF